jgi:hypothetical protein
MCNNQNSSYCYTVLNYQKMVLKNMFLLMMVICLWKYGSIYYDITTSWDSYSPRPRWLGMAGGGGTFSWDQAHIALLLFGCIHSDAPRSFTEKENTAARAAQVS